VQRLSQYIFESIIPNALVIPSACEAKANALTCFIHNQCMCFGGAYIDTKKVTIRHGIYGWNCGSHCLFVSSMSSSTS
jgi:hypothetical protein